MPKINVYTDETIGQVRPIHGVNNGPVTYGALVDVSDYFISSGIPLVRLHDPNWPYPREVDIHIVFPDFDKDPSDPNSYDFSQTDEYLRTVLATGAKIVYRLGESIEHTERKYFVHPPKDYKKWAEICIGIIRHYNHGWADGFHYGIEYWEIWNEPDIGDRMWTGSLKQHLELYETASVAIKQFDPSLKIGGPAIANPTSDYVPEFLEHCRSRSLPLDFFSWHTYTADPQRIVSNAKHVRGLLDQYGYDKAESHLNEWNYMTGDFAVVWNRGNEFYRKKVFDLQKGPEGASFVSHVFNLLLDLPVDQANYYDGTPTALFCGMFDYHGVPQKTYYAFEAFEKLRQLPSRLRCELSEEVDGLSSIAARDDEGNLGTIISNFSSEQRTVTLKLNGSLTSTAYSIDVYAIDEQHSLELVSSEGVESGSLELTLPPYSIRYMKAGR